MEKIKGAKEINKEMIVYVHTTHYETHLYSVIRKNKILIFFCKTYEIRYVT